MSNEVKLTGKVANVKKFTTSGGKTISRFGLSFYNGKDKDGKSKYAFINCTYFGDTNQTDYDVDCIGYISSDEWIDKTTNKKRSNIVLMVKEIKNTERKKVDNKVDEKEDFDDECPF